MKYALEGIQVGLLLAILVGPLVMVLVQASLERGTRAGLAVGLGIWVSDALCIVAVSLGMRHLQQLTKWSGFEPLVGGVGAVILLGIGVATFVSKPPVVTTAQDQRTVGRPPYGSLWLKGFAVNTFNPFTIIFWISITSTMIIERQLPPAAAQVFYTAVFATIVITDSLKVLLAKRIRPWLRPHHLQRVRWVSGLALCGFGIVLLIRVMGW